VERFVVALGLTAFAALGLGFTAFGVVMESQF
jgi:hypothetical protein